MAAWRDDPKADLAIRLAVAIPFAALGMVILVRGARLGGFAAAGAVILATACFIVAGIMVAPWVAQRFGNVAGTLFYPDRRFTEPQAILGVAEGKRSRGLPREALAEYEQVLAKHPDEVRCFVAMMDIAVRDLHDPVLADGFYRRGCSDLASREAREQLRQARDEILRDSEPTARA